MIGYSLYYAIEKHIDYVTDVLAINSTDKSILFDQEYIFNIIRECKYDKITTIARLRSLNLGIPINQAFNDGVNYMSKYQMGIGMLEKMLTYGIDISFINEIGDTFLHIIIRSVYKMLVKDYENDPQYKNSLNRVHFNKYIDVLKQMIKQMIELGNDINIVNNDNLTPLGLAYDLSNLFVQTDQHNQVVKILRSKGGKKFIGEKESSLFSFFGF